MNRLSTETNRALVRRAVTDIWNGLDLELADCIFDPAYVNHGGVIPDLVTGPESIKFAVVLQHTAFPRLQLRERALVSEENMVELKWVARHGLAPCDRTARTPLYLAHGTTLVRCTDNRIVESWTTWDCPVHGDVTAADGPQGPLATLDRLAG